MTPGLVSVMMPAYNAASYIAEAIDSVVAQSYRDWELLVVDDGSTDATGDIVRRIHDPRVRLIPKENGGESTARNVALDHARGEFIAYLDADDAWFPQHLAVTVGFLRAHPQRDAVYTDGFHIDERGVRLVSLQSRRRGPFEGRLYEQAVRASDLFGPPICVVLRHEIVAQHRLRYDPRIVIGPDWEFFIRYTDLATFGYLPDRTCLYRVHRSNITTRVNPARRAASLALCREKAIKMASFAGCSVETRVATFYELMVNLLAGDPERRASVAAWPEFADLPAAERARLLRLMATDALTRGRDHRHVSDWLRAARDTNPADWRARVLSAAYRTSPRLCGAAFRARSPFHPSERDAAPFADLARSAADTASR